jgi:hypothetical protein
LNFRSHRAISKLLAAITRGSMINANTHIAAPQRGHRLRSMSDTSRRAVSSSSVLASAPACPRRRGLRVWAQPRHDEAAAASVRGEDSVIPNEMNSRARQQRRKAREEIERFEQELGRAPIDRWSGGTRVPPLHAQ